MGGINFPVQYSDRGEVPGDSDYTDGHYRNDSQDNLKSKTNLVQRAQTKREKVTSGLNPSRAMRAAQQQRKKRLFIIGGAVAVVLVIVAIVVPVVLTQSKKASKSSSSGSGGSGSSAVSGKTGSLIVADDGSKFTYTNEFGGDWQYDSTNPFAAGGKAQTWSKRVGGEEWVWGTDIARGVNLGYVFYSSTVSLLMRLARGWLGASTPPPTG